PCSIGHLIREEIPVMFVTVRPNHEVDAGTASQYPAHSERHAASVEVRAMTTREGPVALARKVQRPLICFHDAGHIVASTRLQQQDADSRILSQPTPHPRAGRTGPADDEIV